MRTSVKVLVGVVAVYGVLFALYLRSNASSSQAPVAADTTVVRFAPDSVILDFRSGEMTIAGALSHASGPLPPRVWVWAFFVLPGVSTEGSYSDAPIELAQPFASGSPAKVAARGPFHWATNSDIPRRGYVAHIRVSARGPGAAMIPSRLRDRTAPTGVAVTER